MSRTNIACRNCKYWSFDMDMEPFCTHPQAGSAGTDIIAMRSTRKLTFAKENCGPEAKFFVQGDHRYAEKEANV